METSITFVSLGPGEPDLITLKALKILQSADVIFCPSTQSRQGDSVSRSADILRELEIPASSLRLFGVPMSKDRTDAMQAYDQVHAEATTEHRNGKNVVIVAEGDSGFYSSIHYIYDRFVADGIPVQRVAGVPAFIAAGAVAGLHVVKQEEKLIVLPGIVEADELQAYLAAGMTVVIMKLSQCTATIQSFIARFPTYSYHYFENVGTAKEYYSNAAAELQTKTFPYFSLMIIKGGRVFGG